MLTLNCVIKYESNTLLQKQNYITLKLDEKTAGNIKQNVSYFDNFKKTNI